MISLSEMRFDGIDYEFRPVSYWEQDPDPLTAILRNVKGRNRRQMIRDYWEAGRLDELDDSLLAGELDDGVRHKLGRIHPSFMGGEYLPDVQPQETEGQLLGSGARSDLTSISLSIPLALVRGSELDLLVDADKIPGDAPCIESLRSFFSRASAERWEKLSGNSQQQTQLELDDEFRLR